MPSCHNFFRIFRFFLKKGEFSIRCCVISTIIILSTFFPIVGVCPNVLCSECMQQEASRRKKNTISIDGLPDGGIGLVPFPCLGLKIWVHHSSPGSLGVGARSPSSSLVGPLVWRWWISYSEHGINVRQHKILLVVQWLNSYAFLRCFHAFSYDPYFHHAGEFFGSQDYCENY